MRGRGDRATNPARGPTHGLGTDPIAAALERFAAIDSYRVTLRSSSDAGVQEIRYHYRKPGFVRMDFMRPYRGAVLVYDPQRRRATLWPFGPGRFPRLDLGADNPLIRDPRGHSVDRSDAGALLRNARKLQEHGSAEVVGEEPVGNRRAWRVVVSGRHAIDGVVHRYDLWLAHDSLFPLKAESRDVHHRLIEASLMDDVEIGIAFPDRFFDP